MGLRVLFRFHLHYHGLQMSHYRERSATTLDRAFPETNGHPHRMHVTTSVSSATNLEFDWETFSKTRHTTSVDS